ncbi:MAG: hypothetical protein IIZ07_00190 [Ruminococcus sp.]|nr:hypothetical protein [Ruminococcus sp.]
MKNQIKAKKTAITKEKNRLTKICENLPENKKALAVGLIENIAFQRIELQGLRDFLAVNGWTEMFSQSEKQEPYSRIRPEADIFIKTLSLYAKNIKTLSEMSPKPVNGLVDESDGFDAFAEGRDRA